MQEAYKIGNAQSIGSYQIQSSYFASRYDDSRCLAVLADGTADHINGRRCAVLAAEACMHQFKNIPERSEVSVFFESLAAKIVRDMHEIIYLGKTPYLSFSCQYFCDRELYYYSVGGNQVFLFDGSEYHLLKENCGRIRFERGMTAGIISHGVWEALNEKEMISYLIKREHPYDKAQKMIMGLKEKNRKIAGNAAVIVVEGCL